MADTVPVGHTLGVDVSVHNPFIPGGYRMFADGGVKFAWARMTKGYQFKDTMFKTHWDGFRAAEVLTGAYHVYDPYVPWRAQADWAIKNLPDEKIQLPLMLDVELSGGKSKSYLSSEVAALLQELSSRLGYQVVIYTGGWWWEQFIIPGLWGRKYDYWLASYPYAAGSVNLSDWKDIPWPSLTRWPKPVSGGNPARLWQFSGDKFRLPGATSLIDLNLFKGTYPEFLSWAGLEILLPPPSQTSDVITWAKDVDGWAREEGYKGVQII